MIPTAPRVIDRCSNVCCPNQAHEGTFVIAHLGDTPHRPVLVPLCTPCAHAIPGQIPE